MNRKIETLDVTYSDSEYFTVNDLKLDLSFGCDYTILTSVRNVGKSYAAMEYALELVQSGKTVLWERYNKEEFAMSVKTWANFAPHLKPIKGNIKTLMDDESGGKLLMIQTSLATNIKGYDDDLDKLPVLEIKDEFLPVRYTNNTRFLTEFTDAMEIRKTFKRNSEMRSLYLGNNLNWMNPYTIGWQIPPLKSGETLKITDIYTMNKDEIKLSASRSILWHSIKPTEKMLNRIFKNEVASLNQSDLSEYFNNQFYKEYECIEKCPDMKIQLSPHEIMSENYYMNFRFYNGKMYICKVAHDRNKEVFVSEPEYIDIEKRHLRVKSIGHEMERHFDNGMCIFDSMNTYYAFFRWIVNLRKRL